MADIGESIEMIMFSKARPTIAELFFFNAIAQIFSEYASIATKKYLKPI